MIYCRLSLFYYLKVSVVSASWLVLYSINITLISILWYTSFITSFITYSLGKLSLKVFTSDNITIFIFTLKLKTPDSLQILMSRFYNFMIDFYKTLIFNRFPSLSLPQGIDYKEFWNNDSNLYEMYSDFRKNCKNNNPSYYYCFTDIICRLVKNLFYGC